MADLDLQRLKRLALANPQDREVAERAVSAHARARVALPLDLIEPLVWPDLEAYQEEVRSSVLLPQSTESWKRIMDLPPAMRGVVLTVIFTRPDSSWVIRRPIWMLCCQLLRKSLILCDEHLVVILKGARKAREAPWRDVLRAVEQHVERSGLSPLVADALDELRGGSPLESNDPLEAFQVRLTELRDDYLPIPLVPTELWASSALSWIEAQTTGQQRPWRRLIGHASRATTPSPSELWMSRARELLDSTPRGRDQILVWLELIGPQDRLRACADVLRGLIWFLGQVPDEAEVREALSRLALVCYMTPAAPKIGNACVVALFNQGVAAYSTLKKLREQVENRQGLKTIRRVLNRL